MAVMGALARSWPTGAGCRRRAGASKTPEETAGAAAGAGAAAWERKVLRVSTRTVR